MAFTRSPSLSNNPKILNNYLSFTWIASSPDLGSLIMVIWSWNNEALATCTFKSDGCKALTPAYDLKHFDSQSSQITCNLAGFGWVAGWVLIFNPTLECGADIHKQLYLPSFAIRFSLRYTPRISKKVVGASSPVSLLSVELVALRRQEALICDSKMSYQLMSFCIFTDELGQLESWQGLYHLSHPRVRCCLLALLGDVPQVASAFGGTCFLLSGTAAKSIAFLNASWWRI